MNIQMVNLKDQYLKIKDEVDAAIQDVLDSASFINGPQISEFANDLALFNNLKVGQVIPCANGTDALQIALMALNLREGDEVILPVHTYVATAEVIALLRLKPIFIDVDPNNFNIDITLLEEKISSKTKAIVPVHLYGQCAPMEEILKISNKYNLAVIEDTAQAIGADYYFTDSTSKKAGTIGTIGTTSFFPSKNLGCFGDGGAMYASDDKLAEDMRMIANHGQKIKYHHDVIGVNSRLDTLQAAILSVKLKQLPQYIKARQKVASYYDDSLKDVPGISIPFRESYSSHVFHQYTIKVYERRDELKDFLYKKGIPTMIYYPVPLHMQKAYNNLGYRLGDFPVSEELSKTVLSLPIHTEMAKNELEYIIETLTSFF